jgi:hypothetical protein
MGREKYGTIQLQSTKERKKELSTITEEYTSLENTNSESESDSHSSTSTVRAIHQRADEILSKIHALNPSIRSPSPTESVISRGTQTSPPLPSTSHLHRRRKQVKRPLLRRPRERIIQTDSDSGIPTSTALSYSSDSESSVSTIRRGRSIPSFTTEHRSRSKDSFTVDSPYTAALRRRRQKALEKLRGPRKHHRIRILSVGRDIGDSTFAEDSDPPTPVSKILPKKKKVMEGSTDGISDLERRVKSLRVWKGIEEERKEFLLGEIQRKKRRDDNERMEWA